METKNFSFNVAINGCNKNLVFSAPCENGAVITHRFCPQELLTGGISFISAINGESIDEFISDCEKQVIAMNNADTADKILNIHVAGLVATVMDHISRCGRLIFGDLLIYMDCFSYLLYADGFGEEEVKDIYPHVCRIIVELYPDYIKNTMDLSPFKGSHMDFVLFNASHK